MPAAVERYRATVVTIRDEAMLLVRDRGRHDHSLPAGWFKRGENSIQAGIRVVCQEELGGLTVLAAARLRFCDFIGQRANHKVWRLQVEGTRYIKSREIDDFLWWDMKSDLPTQGHVAYIPSRLRSLGMVPGS